MSIRQEIEKKTEKLLEPILLANSFEMVDVEYVKEGNNWFLRAYIDKPQGINIDDCETVSRALEEELDKMDFIQDAYILEVSSPGLTRPLKKERDYKRNVGKMIEIHTFKPIDKNKTFIGTLKEYNENFVTLLLPEEKAVKQTAESSSGADKCIHPYEDNIDCGLVTIERKNISVIRQYFEF